MAEAYICLFCNQECKGDDDWLAHLKSSGHGVAKIERLLPRLEPIDIEPSHVRTEHHG